MEPNSTVLLRHPCIHPCLLAYSANPWTQALRAAPRRLCRLRAGAPFPALPPPPKPGGHLPEGSTAQLRKGAKERNPSRGCSSGPRPCRPIPTPTTVPSSGRAGTRRCEGSCPALPEQSPPREPAAAHRASDKGEQRRRAPSLCSCSGAGGRPRRWGAIRSRSFQSCGISLLGTQRPVGVTQLLPPALPHLYLLCSCLLTS